MPAIVEFPTVVKESLEQFGHLFANEPERVHFAEYLTGLMVAYHKNVSAINREFAATTDQSCLNRWVTEADWDAERLNHERLAWLQKEPSTRYSAQGVIPIDNVLVEHSGNPHVRARMGMPEHVAWAYERPGGGRSFGFTGGRCRTWPPLPASGEISFPAAKRSIPRV